MTHIVAIIYVAGCWLNHCCTICCPVQVTPALWFHVYNWKTISVTPPPLSFSISISLCLSGSGFLLLLFPEASMSLIHSIGLVEKKLTAPLAHSPWTLPTSQSKVGTAVRWNHSRPHQSGTEWLFSPGSLPQEDPGLSHRAKQHERMATPESKRDPEAYV